VTTRFRWSIYSSSERRQKECEFRTSGVCKKIVHFLQDIKSPFCDHPFPVVTKREISDLCRKIWQERREEERRHELETSRVYFVTTRFRWSIFSFPQQKTREERTSKEGDRTASPRPRVGDSPRAQRRSKLQISSVLFCKHQFFLCEQGGRHRVTNVGSHFVSIDDQIPTLTS
jgi:hypothetical protein